MSENDLPSENSLFLPMLSIPVIVDSNSVAGSSPNLSRCVYFTMTTDEPELPVTMTTVDGTIPFVLLGLQGILHSPLPPDVGIFQYPSQWETLVTTIEKIEGFEVDFEYFWIPTELLDLARSVKPREEFQSSSKASRGDVFRLSRRLFVAAWQAARDGVDFDSYATQLLKEYSGDRLPLEIQYSPLETKSIGIWAIEQASAAQIS